ncbi:unnamed protein product [Urochloa decumbens]|uniref:F-box domain-containing protein n=1 Tax=Urochloa decumbens TaxID=240449 RepID=A0ABC9A6D4_9POAL
MSIPTALFKRRGGHERSARYSVRRAVGGVSHMARSSVRIGSGSAAGRLLLQCRPLAAGSSLIASGRRRAGRFLLRRRLLAARPEDRISALSDDLLLLVLRHLDTRTALATGLLSRRWAHLPRELPALDLRIGDLLPPRYHRWVLLYRDICEKGTLLHYRRGAVNQELLPNIRRYERRAMRAVTSSAGSFLEGPRRRVNRLRLEFFITGNAACMNRLITEAIDAWGVDDLEAVAKPIYRQRDDVHTFPGHGLCRKPRTARLRSLKLGGCVLPQLHEYGALTMLVLQDIPESTTASAYEGIFNSCLQLQTFHLISCGCSSTSGRSSTVVVDAPNSEIRELVVEDCTFQWLRLKALPCLQSLASLRSRVLFDSTSFPCLRQWNLTMRLGIILKGLHKRVKLELDMFLGCIPDITSLIIRFTGPYRWIVPSNSPSALLPNLKRLLVADVPSSWDVTWPRLLLEMAPSLERLHINIASCQEEPGEEIPWPLTEFRQHRLMEFVMAGFGGTARQIYLVKFVVRACTALRHVAMFKNGRSLEKGHWNWEMETQHHLWADEEKENTLKLIMDGVPSSTSPIQIVLG